MWTWTEADRRLMIGSEWMKVREDGRNGRAVLVERNRIARTARRIEPVQDPDRPRRPARASSQASAWATSEEGPEDRSSLPLSRTPGGNEGRESHRTRWVTWRCPVT